MDLLEPHPLLVHMIYGSTQAGIWGHEIQRTAKDKGREEKLREHNLFRARLKIFEILFEALPQV